MVHSHLISLAPSPLTRNVDKSIEKNLLVELYEVLNK